MLTRRACPLLLSTIVFTLLNSNVSACEICTIPRLGRQENLIQSKDSRNKWFFEFLFEEQNWNEWPARDAHLLHEDGHDVHNKTTEEFYHFALGRIINDDVSVTMEIPYVIRNSLGVADGKVGNKDKAKGIGDLLAMLNYRIVEDNDFAMGIVGGVKFPTGETDEADSAGAKFEPELQPGSGSYDFLVGGIFEHQRGRFIVKGNLSYTFKTEGDQEYEFGDLFSTSVFIDYILNPDAQVFKTKVGIDINYQLAQKDIKNDVKVADGGGNTLLVGPSLTIEGPKNTSIFGNFLYPVHQDLGGVHQEMSFVWTAGGKVKF